jgi:hypothetical protein
MQILMAGSSQSGKTEIHFIAFKSSATTLSRPFFVGTASLCARVANTDEPLQILRRARREGLPSCRRLHESLVHLTPAPANASQKSVCCDNDSIVTESHSVVSKIPQSLAFTSASTAAEGNSLASSGSLREKACSASALRTRGAIAVVLVFLSVGGFPPLLGHFDFGAHDQRVGGEAGQTGKAEQVPCNLARRMVIGEERPQIGGALRNSSVSASESSSITTVQPAPVG